MLIYGSRTLNVPTSILPFGLVILVPRKEGSLGLLGTILSVVHP